MPTPVAVSGPANSIDSNVSLLLYLILAGPFLGWAMEWEYR